ncbi:MAG: hypothetical protein RR612_01475, partial [Oscillospiraceae bacterium]
NMARLQYIAEIAKRSHAAKSQRANLDARGATTYTFCSPLSDNLKYTVQQQQGIVKTPCCKSAYLGFILNAMVQGA